LWIDYRSGRPDPAEGLEDQYIVFLGIIGLTPLLGTSININHGCISCKVPRMGLSYAALGEDVKAVFVRVLSYENLRKLWLTSRRIVRILPTPCTVSSVLPVSSLRFSLDFGNGSVSLIRTVLHGASVTETRRNSYNERCHLHR
jgi:hypothetical protein